MNQPCLYSKNNDLPFNDVACVLKKYSHIIRRKMDKEQNILDVGCGDGRVTEELLYPLFENIQKFVAVDVSPEMIQFAKVHHSKEKLSYKQFDITTRQLDVDLEETFDHIFSFYCINWVQDQRQCARNLYNMLKPSGDIFLLFLVTSNIYEVYEKLSTHKIWGEHTNTFKDYISPYYFSKHPEKEYRDLLCQVGFDINICEIINKSYTFEDVISWKKFALAINPFLRKMSDDMREDFAESMLNEIRTLNYTTLNSSNGEETVQVHHKLLMVHASKPK